MLLYITSLLGIGYVGYIWYRRSTVIYHTVVAPTLVVLANFAVHFQTISMDPWPVILSALAIFFLACIVIFDNRRDN